jgi:hypothetical protein
MGYLEEVKLTALITRSGGKLDTKIGFIKGSIIHTHHSDLAVNNLRELPGSKCTNISRFVCMLGTFIADILSARRHSIAPAICPERTLLIFPIFSKTSTGNGFKANAMVQILAATIPMREEISNV